MCILRQAGTKRRAELPRTVQSARAGHLLRAEALRMQGRACSTSAFFLYTASTFSTAMYSPASTGQPSTHAIAAHQFMKHTCCSQGLGIALRFFENAHLLMRCSACALPRSTSVLKEVTGVKQQMLPYAAAVLQAGICVFSKG